MENDGRRNVPHFTFFLTPDYPPSNFFHLFLVILVGGLAILLLNSIRMTLTDAPLLFSLFVLLEELVPLTPMVELFFNHSRMSDFLVEHSPGCTTLQVNGR